MRELRSYRRSWLPSVILTGIAVAVAVAGLDVLFEDAAFTLARPDPWLRGLALAIVIHLGWLRGLRLLRQGVAVNSRFAAGEPVAGAPDMEEAERLLVVMEREGWLRYQLVRDGEPPRSSPG